MARKPRIRLCVSLGLITPLPADKPLRVKSRLLLFLCGCAMPVLTSLVARMPDLISAPVKKGASLAG